ncbi:hypothetical protein SPI_08794 [Niveomyces insectorum RCEF 264]|uniref:Uncharacterized protein n=1 Tax=Niveomyces insectorum RCEF 264 TaxID=1081102 RepID=A0A167MMT4_9HYPO|nr:hypothetical protein SPI_08794 [Niveomyces insectorum RCEF 264]
MPVVVVDAVVLDVIERQIVARRPGPGASDMAVPGNTPLFPASRWRSRPPATPSSSNFTTWSGRYGCLSKGASAVTRC